MITKDFLLSFFEKKAPRPMSFRDLSAALDLSPPERRKFKRILRELVEEGAVIRTRRGLYGRAEEMSLVTGYFEAHRDGYGFVILEKPGERDLFVPARAVFGAMDNDRVVARLENEARREGRIIRILERANSRITGTFEADRGAFYVVPKSKRIPFSLYVSPKDKDRAKDGDRVIAEITTYPGEKSPATGRIVGVLKRPESPADEIEGIIEEFSLSRRFLHDVLEEARELYGGEQSAEYRRQKSEVGGRNKEARKDLRYLPTVTIDGERAKDFDDAVSVGKTAGIYTLWVHIADVGFYVKEGSLIDAEARKRGTSVYFPDRVIPMLPKELSEDLCSLRPKEDKAAFTVEMEFDSHGRRLRSRFYPSLINSDERMTYTSVKKMLVDGDMAERAKYSCLLRDFEMMEELCNILKKRRLGKGSLDFDLPEPEVLLDIQGNPEAIVKAERNFAHMIIEEFMIAANEAVAEHLEVIGVPSIYRVHEEPDPLKLEVIMNLMRAAGLVKKKETLTPKDFSGLLAHVAGTPQEEIINSMILRSLKQARYSNVNVGHFGLASRCYTHFTSPIRRYPDLVVHRILREALEKKALGDDRMKELESTLPDIAFHSSRMERLADDAERAVLDAMRVWFMKDKLGEEFEGRVVSVTAYGLKVRLIDYYVEGFLHVSYMTDDFYQFDEKSMSLNGKYKKKRFGIGKELKVRIDRVDMEERAIILGL